MSSEHGKLKSFLVQTMVGTFSAVRFAYEPRIVRIAIATRRNERIQTHSVPRALSSQGVCTMTGSNREVAHTAETTKGAPTGAGAVATTICETVEAEAGRTGQSIESYEGAPIAAVEAEAAGPGHKEGALVVTVEVAGDAAAAAVEALATADVSRH